MKARIICKIGEVTRDNNGFVSLNLISASGRVETHSPAAQEVTLVGTLKLKTVVANQLKIGELIEINLTTPETNEGST